MQIHKLSTACLTSIILVAVFFIRSNNVPITVSRFDRPLTRSIEAASGAAILEETSTPAPEPPDTSIYRTEVLANKLTSRPQFTPETNQADFYTFVAHISDGHNKVMRGVYVPGIFALPIIQQPANNPIFVSNKHDRVTQFQSAARNGVTGLLAHNYLAGSHFYKLTPGHKALIVSGDGTIQQYQVISIHRFQKMNPSDLHSKLIDLSTGGVFSTREIFRRFYQGEHQLIFQTCLERDGRLDWGLMFVVAVPLG